MHRKANAACCAQEKGLSDNVSRYTVKDDDVLIMRQNLNAGACLST